MGSPDTSDVASLDSYIDRTGCELVERVPGKVSAGPLFAALAFWRTRSFRTLSLVLLWKRFTRTIPTCQSVRYSGSSRLLNRNTGSRYREGFVRPDFEGCAVRVIDPGTGKLVVAAATARRNVALDPSLPTPFFYILDALSQAVRRFEAEFEIADEDAADRGSSPAKF